MDVGKWLLRTPHYLVNRRFMETQMEREYVKGGEFLIADQSANEVFTPEDLTDEHRMIGETTREFVDNEVHPQLPAMENHAWEVARELVKKAGDLGLIGASTLRRVRA